MPKSLVALLFALCLAQGARAQFNVLETEHLRLIYYGQAQAYLVRHVARTFENALAYHRVRFGYEPREKTTVFVHDFFDYGNAGVDTAPENLVTLAVAPMRYVFETYTANERINAVMNHEVTHLVANDLAAGRDLFFRRLFGGKVGETDENPLSVLYSHLTVPRRASPRWYQEGLGVFMETFMDGGLGRAIGGYDEMVFRALVHDGSRFYDPLGLEAAGTSVNFQVVGNAYLYGTRFMSYLALAHGPERLIDWTARAPGSHASFARQFRQVYGTELDAAWRGWVEWERAWQDSNLAAIRRNPVTPFRPLSEEALGSVSRAHFDAARGVLYVAVNRPGQVAHLAALDVRSGRVEALHEVKGAALYDVCALAFDPAGTLFFTTDNNRWRDLRAFDLATGRVRTLLPDARIGDLAFDRADRALWGVRHLNGISTLARIPYPYETWRPVHSWPYGQDLYDLDVSPDGRYLVGALAEVSGRQSLVRMETADLLAGRVVVDTLFDFETSNPANFTFSPDGRYLYGSSYYTGVSNVFRYDLDARRMEVLSNAETGFFRPFPVSDDSVFVFRYTAQGFVPGLIPGRRVPRVGAIRFLGQAVVERHPVVRGWIAPSPARVDLDSLTVRQGPYRSLAHLRLRTVYPVVEGYKDLAAVGLRLNFAAPVNLHRMSVTAAVTPAPGVPRDERLHLGLHYGYRGWTLDAGYNATDFYDLFGPTKTSRRGYGARLQYRHVVVEDWPRQFAYQVQAAAYGGFERLPDYQNVAAPVDRLVSASAALQYRHHRSSLGAVDDEKGVAWSLNAGSTVVQERLYPRLHATLDRGFQLPGAHLSLWLRGAAGAAHGRRDDPFARFYFGGFGNNWVDRGEVKRFRAYTSFPGAGLNAVGGTTFGRLTAEAILPPLRFERAGLYGLYLQWARLTLFGGGLVVDPDRPALRRSLADAGAQVDLSLALFSHLRLTLSAGYAAAFERSQTPGRELMVSLKVL